jgi:hypothetical protein
MTAMISALSRYSWTFLLFLLLGAQYAFWRESHHRTPDMTIVPTPPGKMALDALSFGDSQFLFRCMVFLLGNAGDTFGRSTPLYKYDMRKIYTWFTLLDGYDHTSDLPASLASYYYSQTQNKPDARHLVRYLSEHAAPDIERKWWWLTQATYIALHKIKDKDLALEVAKPLATARNIPLWAQQLPAIVHEKRGEFGDALYIMEGILQSDQKIPDGELRYMEHFIRERIEKMDEVSEAAKERLGEAKPVPEAPPAEK